MTDRRVALDAPRIAHQFTVMGADGDTHRLRLTRHARVHLVRRGSLEERADPARGAWRS